jgi:ribosomal protein S27AE
MVHNPGKACMTCHEPHNPTTPRSPEDCSACHRGIANTKLVSHHAGLECTQCHVVPAEHKNNPRVALAQKPENRSTCGACHAKGADSPKNIPRIDLASHNPRYKCWDCHYPHNPEAS